MYRLVYTTGVAKKIKKLDKPVREEMKNRLELIARNPYIGQKKKGKLNNIWGYGFNWCGTAYRIAYQIYDDELVVLIIAAGSHESFWEELSKHL